jgi:hypothetical protein
MDDEPDPLALLAYEGKLRDARTLLRMMPDVDGALEAELALDRVIAAISGGVEPGRP